MSFTQRWVILEPPGPKIREELKKYSALEQQLLYSRGIISGADAGQFLDPDYLESHDPFELKDMEKAVQRVQQAKQGGEKVVVYGDYDADGATATSLLIETLRIMELDVDWYIPDRFAEGYGLNLGAIQKLSERGTTLIITVDCGIRAHEQVEFAKQNGIDIIISDHHLPAQTLPAALAVINPSLPEQAYPFQHLAGVGVAYKISQALHQVEELEEPSHQLDLVAIGTVADIVSLLGENRSLVQRGLHMLNISPRRLGIATLISVAGFTDRTIDAGTIGFGLAPRINAAGRMEKADIPVRLLLTSDEGEALELAETLESLNRRRRKLTTETQSVIMEQLELKEEVPDLILAVDESFHEGVIGLSASKIVDKYYRPTLIAKSGPDITKGSARSIPEFDITEALSKCADILDKFGGHRMAAGFSVPTEQLEEFRLRLLELVDEVFAGEVPEPHLKIDAVVNFQQMDENILLFMDRMEPFGASNPKPLFAVNNVDVHDRRPVGAGKTHLKLTLGQPGKWFDAIAFQQGHLADTLSRKVDIAFNFERNEYQGVSTMQLNIQDIRDSRS